MLSSHSSLSSICPAAFLSGSTTYRNEGRPAGFALLNPCLTRNWSSNHTGNTRFHLRASDGASREAKAMLRRVALDIHLLPRGTLCLRVQSKDPTAICAALQGHTPEDDDLPAKELPSDGLKPRGWGLWSGKGNVLAQISTESSCQ